MDEHEKLQILRKAAEQAMANGWEPNAYDLQDLQYLNRTWPIFFFDRTFAQCLWPVEPDAKVQVNYTLTADPDGQGKMDVLEGWQWFQQQLITADDPYKWLKENL